MTKNSDAGGPAHFNSPVLGDDLDGVDVRAGINRVVELD
jgi:hypothetical protein